MIQPSDKKPPEILSEEDVPLLHEGNVKREKEDRALSKEKNAVGPIEDRKFSLGSTTLGWCIIFMVLCIVLSIWHPDNELIKSGFEAFKLIVMTIFGYIFGSNSAKRD